MDVKYTLVGSDDGSVYKIETVEHEGALWLVPIWVEVVNPAGQEPGRAIRLTGLNYETSKAPGVDFILRTPIPKSILDGLAAPEDGDGLLVYDRPKDGRLAKPN